MNGVNQVNGEHRFGTQHPLAHWVVGELHKGREDVPVTWSPERVALLPVFPALTLKLVILVPPCIVLALFQLPLC